MWDSENVIKKLYPACQRHRRTRYDAKTQPRSQFGPRWPIYSNHIPCLRTDVLQAHCSAWPSKTRSPPHAVTGTKITAAAKEEGTIESQILKEPAFLRFCPETKNLQAEYITFTSRILPLDQHTFHSQTLHHPQPCLTEVASATECASPTPASPPPRYAYHPSSQPI